MNPLIFIRTSKAVDQPFNSTEQHNTEKWGIKSITRAGFEHYASILYVH